MRGKSHGGTGFKAIPFQVYRFQINPTTGGILVSGGAVALVLLNGLFKPCGLGEVCRSLGPSEHRRNRWGEGPILPKAQHKFHRDGQNDEDEVETTE